MDALDAFSVEAGDGQVILTMTAAFGETIRYWISPSDAAMIGASLLVTAVEVQTA
jgi:hypothetical protein